MGKKMSELNKIDGNTLLMHSNVDDYDLYHCSKGDHYVTEDQWNVKKNCCYDCFWGIYKGESNGT